MAHKGSRPDTMRYLSMISQLGLNIIVPILLCLWAGRWLQNRFGLGQWVVFIALLLGLGAAVTGAFQYLHTALQEAKTREKEEQES